jgi:tight adherence protein B
MSQQLLPAIIIVFAVVISVLLLGYGITIARRGTTEEMQERLSRYAGTGEIEPERAADLSRRQSGRLAQMVERAVAERSFTANIRQQLARADLRLTVGEWLIIRVTAVALGFVFGFLLGAATNGLTLLTGLGLGILGVFAPGWYLRYRIARRVRMFINQLGDTITLMANSLRAGYSLLQAMELVSRESPPPISDEFRRVVHEVGLGISNQQAMAHLLRRLPSDDLDLLITAINIQFEVGGNLAQILDIIGHTIRERVRIKGEIAVLTAQQTISGYVITALPVCLAVIMFLIAPTYIGGMFAFPWICMPIGSGIMIIIGFFVMKKITNIEV